MSDAILDKFGDYGSESSRRDEFQKHYAAFWCIEMLLDNSISEVICEYGEDVVICRYGAYELHQVKTKQESTDDWRLEDLIPIVAKTFAMAPYFINVSGCRFVSNDGATGVLFQLKKILSTDPACWNADDKQVFDDFCKNHSSRILKRMQEIDSDNTDTVDDVNTRLLLLRIDTDFHHMEYIQDSNLKRLRQFLEKSPPTINGFTYTGAELVDIYDRLMGLVNKATLGRTREEKTITKQDVMDCLSIPIRRGILYRFPTETEISAATGTTRMERKLRLGGFNQVFIEDARDLMVTIKYKARSWEFGDVPTLLEDIRFRVKHLWADCYDKVCQAQPDQQALGRILLEELKRDLPILVDHYRQSQLPIDDLFLLGTAWELTSECKAYWSQQRQD